MSYLKFLQDTVGRSEMVHFNQRHNILYLYNDLYNYKVGDTMILHAYLYTDPDTFNEVWTDQWLRDYTAALIKRQWGQNMLKYDGFQLPSGMTLNGREIYQDSLNDIERLNERLQNEETLPPDMMWG